MPEKIVIIPAAGAKPLASYSPGIQYGDLLFTAGQIGLDPASGKLVEGGVGPETSQALENLGTILEAGGSSFASLLKVTIFLADISDYGAVNEIYAEFVGVQPPARSALQVAALPAGARVEIEAVAAVE
jgi:2-iminobutanoate/2-iminopropanoate deaminase